MFIDLSQLILFIPAALALNLTPGNDNLYCFGKGLSSGPKAGVVASLGIATGSLLHSLLAAFGLAALLSAQPVAFEAIRWTGVVYLLWVGINSFQASSTISVEGNDEPESLTRIWLGGTLVNLFNPKVAIFVLAFIPQFIDPDRGSTIIQFLIFGTILNIMGTIVAGTIGGFAGKIGHHLANNHFLARAMHCITGTIFLGLAARLALESN